MVWYTSTPLPQAQKTVNLFEKEYGIKVELFRSGGSAILRRFQQEGDAGRVAADVLTTSDPAAAAMLARKGTFVAFKPKNFDKIPDAAKDKDGYFVAQRLNLMTNYIRSDKVPEADEPKTWNDLTHPKYKGKMVIGDPSFTSLLVSVVGMTSKERGWGFYEKLRANDTMVVQGNQQAADMLKRGERLIAVGALDSYAAEDRAAGHPMKTLYPSDGVFVIPVADLGGEGRAEPECREASRRIHHQRRSTEDVSRRWRVCGTQRYRGAGRLAPVVEPENPAGGLRLHREGSASDQEAVQRDISVARCVASRSSLPGMTRMGLVQHRCVAIYGTAGLRTCSVSSMAWTGPRAPRRRCSRSSSR